MRTLFQDVRYAIRLLQRSPGFAMTAVLTLAVSIGANAAIFSAVQGVLIAPLPYPDPDRLVRLFEEAPDVSHFPMSPLDFRDYRAELRTFDALAAYNRADLQLGDVQQPEQLRGMQVSSGFFRLLGVQPALGREFEMNEEVQGSADVVILSHSFWTRRFNADPGIVGRAVRLSGRPFQIVGVLPEGFSHVGGTYRTYGHGEPVDVWWPLRVPREERAGLRYSHFFNVVGRIRRDVGWADMERDLRTTGVSVAKRYPSPNSPWTARAVPLKDEIVGTLPSTLLIIAGAASAVLLLACVNIAGLLLGRSSARSREIGVRSALGASPGDILGLVLRQGMKLTALGVFVGLGGAVLASRLIVTMLFGVSRLDLPTYIGVVPAPTVASIAARAGVAADTVYATFGNKARVLTAVIDERLGASSGAANVLDRPQAHAVRDDTDQRRQLHTFAHDIAALDRPAIEEDLEEDGECAASAQR